MPESTLPASYNVVRAMTKDGGFRVVAASTAQLVRDAAVTHDLTGSAAAMFGELLTGAVLLRETMAPQYRLQLSLDAANGVKLLADSQAEGLTRGLAAFPPGNPVAHFGAGATLKASRIMYGGRLHQSVVAASDADGIGGALMVYAQNSAQVTATIAVGCVDDPSGIRHCGGYVVQLLPDPPQGPLMVMTERLAEFADVGAMLDGLDGDVDKIVGELLYGMDYTILDTQTAYWGCTCSQERVVGALASLGVDEITKIVESGEVLDIDCDYCLTAYQVGPEQLKSLLVRS